MSVCTSFMLVLVAWPVAFLCATLYIWISPFGKIYYLLKYSDWISCILIGIEECILRLQGHFSYEERQKCWDFTQNLRFTTMWLNQIVTIIRDRFKMLVTEPSFWYLFFIMLKILSATAISQIGHKYPKVVTNTFCHQHPSPSSMFLMLWYPLCSKNLGEYIENSFKVNSYRL